jgi:NAD(P)-dependent dehydrogenase (short-subunit alcohol dehydrogenase family)
MSRLAGKAALVTGGGSGIGLAVARAFLDEGARVAITGRDADKLRRAAAELAGGDRLFHHPCDVTDPDAVTALVRAVNDRLGPLDILVNNAGLNIRERAFRELTPQSWRRLLAANLDGAFYCTHAVVPRMRQHGGGLIININSIAGKRSGTLSGVAYNASKFGLRALAMGLAAEEKDAGLRVCSIYPGEVDTPILDLRPTPLGAEHRRQILRPEDVAAAVVFVATLPPHATVPEMVITPASATYV